MRFTRPINREVDIDGDTFIVSMDESGIGFRLKGKRRVARLEWADAFDMARGEQGATAREYLGLSEAGPRRHFEETTPEIDARREAAPIPLEEEYLPQAQDTTGPADEDARRSTAAQAGNE